MRIPPPAMTGLGDQTAQEGGGHDPMRNSRPGPAGPAGDGFNPGVKCASFPLREITSWIGKSSISCAALSGTVVKFIPAGKAGYAPGTNGAWRWPLSEPGKSLSYPIPVSISV